MTEPTNKHLNELLELTLSAQIISMALQIQASATGGQKVPFAVDQEYINLALDFHSRHHQGVITMLRRKSG